MKNFIQEGDVLNITAPATVSSGGLVEFGDLLGVAVTDIASGALGAIKTTGVFKSIPKASASVFAAGDAVYYDVADNEFNVDSANPKKGYALEAAGDGDLTFTLVLVN